MAKRLLAQVLPVVALVALVSCEAAAPVAPGGKPNAAPPSEIWLRYSVTPTGIQTVRPGHVARFSIRIESRRVGSADVEFEARSVPPGLTPVLQFSRVASPALDNQLTVEVPASAAGGYQIELRARLLDPGDAELVWYTTALEFDVQSTDEQGFHLACSPPAMTLLPGGDRNLTVLINRKPGFRAPIDVTFSPLPDALSVDPRADRVLLDSSTHNVFRRLATAAPPTYSLVAIGSADGLERRCTVLVTMPSALLTAPGGR